MNKFIKIIIISLALTLFIVTVPISQAADGESSGGAFTSTLKNNFNDYLKLVGAKPGYNVNNPEASSGILTSIIALIISLVGIIFLILIIFSGIQWMTASGNEEKITNARTRMIQASIGLGITVCAFVISYTVFSFLQEEYLDTPYGGINPPENSQDLIACSSDVQCEDRPTRKFCYAGNCIECLSDANCVGRPEIPASATYCHPTWKVCMLPQGITCENIQDDALCLGQGCKWLVDSPQHSTWDNGRCVESTNPCPQCGENAPVCVRQGEVEPYTYTCKECIDELIQGACTSLSLCTGGNFCLW